MPKLKQHSVVQKSYQCQFCKVKCRRPQDLRRHLLVHTAASFECDLCGNKFTRYDTLRRHKRDNCRNTPSINHVNKGSSLSPDLHPPMLNMSKVTPVEPYTSATKITVSSMRNDETKPSKECAEQIRNRINDPRPSNDVPAVSLLQPRVEKEAYPPYDSSWHHGHFGYSQPPLMPVNSDAFGSRILFPVVHPTPHFSPAAAMAKTPLYATQSVYVCSPAPSSNFISSPLHSNEPQCYSSSLPSSFILGSQEMAAQQTSTLLPIKTISSEFNEIKPLHKEVNGLPSPIEMKNSPKELFIPHLQCHVPEIHMTYTQQHGYNSVPPLGSVLQLGPIQFTDANLANMHSGIHLHDHKPQPKEPKAEYNIHNASPRRFDEYTR